MSAAIELERVVGLAFVQDGGRRGRLREGVPSGGALVPEALARANGALGNEPGAAGIERFGAMTIVGRDGEAWIAEDDGVARRVRAGERVALGWDGRARARYLALRGGIDVPRVLGGRGTLVAARIGGLGGRALRAGDVLRAGAEAGTGTGTGSGSETDTGSGGAPIRIVAGPDLATHAPQGLAALVGSPRRVSPRSDRTGTRLEGDAIAWRAGAVDASTTPMIAGAIELPASGEPIVLGPDHPTTGGYPVIAVIARVDLGRFHAIPLGREVRFAAIDGATARALWRAERRSLGWRA